MSESNKPLVSVVIPTYNYGHYLCEAVDSALAQTHPNVEIIVVDDGSSDGTKERLAAYGERIVYIYKSNGGISSARNMGIERAKGEYIAFLDADDIWDPEKLECQLKEFSRGADVGLVSCNGRTFNDKHEALEDIVYKNFENKSKFYSELILRNIVSGGSAAVVKRECFQKLGGFDEGLPSSEDWDMWLRISRDYRIYFVERFLVRIRVGFNSVSSTANADRMIETDEKVLQKQKEFNKRFASDTKMQAKAYSYRYLCVAWAYWINQNLKKAFHYIWKSFSLYPQHFLNKQQGGLLVKITFSRFLKI